MTKRPQSKRRPRRSGTLTVITTFAPPSAEADECFLRALRVLMDATEGEEKEVTGEERIGEQIGSWSILR
jgi:hypothetical protein